MTDPINNAINKRQNQTTTIKEVLHEYSSDELNIRYVTECKDSSTKNEEQLKERNSYP